MQDATVNLIQEYLINNIGIFSLSKVPDNILMWSHYADSHKGIVLEFDSNHAYFNKFKYENSLQITRRKTDQAIASAI